MEWILVDDHSADRTEEYISLLPKRGLNLRLLKSRRRGVSHARNEGIAAASGIYLYFLDSDDQIDVQKLEHIAKIAQKEQLDLVSFATHPHSTRSFSPAERVAVLQRHARRLQTSPGAISGPELALQLIVRDAYAAPAWLYLVARGLVTRADLRFPDLQVSEDQVFTFFVFRHALRARHFNVETHTRNIWDGSVSASAPRELLEGQYRRAVDIVRSQIIRDRTGRTKLWEELLVWELTFRIARRDSYRRTKKDTAKFLLQSVRGLIGLTTSPGDSGVKRGNRIFHVLRFSYSRLSRLSFSPVLLAREYLKDALTFGLEVFRITRRKISTRFDGWTNNALACAFRFFVWRNPVRDEFFFMSFQGSRINDNPYALFRELTCQFPDHKMVWASKKRSTEIDGASVVGIKTLGYAKALATCKFIVTNSNLPVWFEKRNTQIYLQTWHGTPLKYLFEKTRKAPHPSYRNRFTKDAANWDLLITQNSYSSGVFKESFPFSGPIFETGYPRNDALVGADSTSRLEARSRLHLDPSEYVILYAPTWRDWQKSGRNTWESPGVPLSMTHALPDATILYRAHSNSLGEAKAQPGRVLDVTDWEDINDLIIAADVLVTDYSSVVFDFSITSKPMILFAPDLEQYNIRRGLNLSTLESFPGPICLEEVDLLFHLLDLSGPSERYTRKYQEWKKVFNSLEDGRASRRVAGVLLGPTRDSL